MEYIIVSVHIYAGAMHIAPCQSLQITEPVSYFKHL